MCSYFETYFWLLSQLYCALLFVLSKLEIQQLNRAWMMELKKHTLTLSFISFVELLSGKWFDCKVGSSVVSLFCVLAIFLVFIAFFSYCFFFSSAVSSFCVVDVFLPFLSWCFFFPLLSIHSLYQLSSLHSFLGVSSFPKLYLHFVLLSSLHSFLPCLHYNLLVFLLSLVFVLFPSCLIILCCRCLHCIPLFMFLLFLC